MVDKSYRNYVVPACQGMPRKPYKSSSKNPAWRLQGEIVPGLSANRMLPGFNGGTSSVKFGRCRPIQSCRVPFGYYRLFRQLPFLFADQFEEV